MESPTVQADWVQPLTGYTYAQDHAQGHVEIWDRARNRIKGFPFQTWAFSSIGGLPSTVADNFGDYLWLGKGPSWAEQPELKICLHLLTTS